MTTLLAIDDDPARLSWLATIVSGHPRLQLVVACCPGCVAREMPGADAVLLDYDLDYEHVAWEEPMGCTCRSTWTGKGDRYVPDLVARGVPVIVHSANTQGGLKMHAALKEAGARTARLSVLEVDAELRWLGQLVVWGVL